MVFISKFEHSNGEPDEFQVEEWTISYFESLLNLFNGFFSKVDVSEAVLRMENIPFVDLVLEQLEGECQAVLDIAAAKTRELFETEMAFMKAYI